ncbi:MAG: hypothetical protein U1F70_10230 [Candidatus Competibacteraceae bacterium]
MGNLLTNFSGLDHQGNGIEPTGNRDMIRGVWEWAMDNAIVKQPVKNAFLKYIVFSQAS